MKANPPALGEADEAVRLLIEATSLTQTAYSQRNVNRILEVRRQIPAKVADVVVVDERLEGLAPTGYVIR